MLTFQRLIEAIAAEGSAALVTIAKVEGSAPREAGARMVVRPSGAFNGTIGGGTLEWEALAAAGVALRAGRGAPVRRTISLGPDLAQCCGGRVNLMIETFDGRDREELATLGRAERAGRFTTEAVAGADGRLHRAVIGAAHAAHAAIESGANGALRERFGLGVTRLWLFGAGHVGRALALALAPLPYETRWIDSRADAFPERAPGNVTMIHATSPVTELAEAPDGAQMLVMTHSHPLDLEIVAAALAMRNFSFVGLIGSATKRARFLSQMRAAGLAEDALSRLVCPIGVAGIEGKEPAVIAASVVAQLLARRTVAEPARTLRRAESGAQARATALSAV